MAKSLELQNAGLGVFPCWARYNNDAGRWDKGPAVVEGLSWKDAAQLPHEGQDWRSGVFGVIVPAGVIIVDFDAYKPGASLAAIEHWLGCEPDWRAAHLQTTVGGGEHYAFRCDFEPAQISPKDCPGLDTRAAGKGFICSGRGYQVRHPADLYALLCPDVLPELPLPARDRLRVPDQPTPTASALPALTEDDGAITDALAHIDPGAPRAEWVRIGCALRALYDGRDDEGEQLFGRWSAGELWHAGPPPNYEETHVAKQWASFKPEGRITGATLYWAAIQGGWRPPARIDIAAFFSEDALDNDTFGELVERIRAEGGNTASVPSLIGGITAAGGSSLQKALLAAELKTVLEESGVKDRAVKDAIDAVIGDATARPGKQAEYLPGAYSAKDVENAQTFLESHYPDGILKRWRRSTWRYNGRHWEELSDERLAHEIALAMAPQLIQESKMAACMRTVLKLVPVLPDDANQAVSRGWAVCQSGVIDLVSGFVHPHNKDVFATSCAPWEYDKFASCETWLTFLRAVFEDDQERIDLLQEWLGYLISGDTRYHKYMFLLGPGRAGKGTIGRVIEALVGRDNCMGGSLTDLVRDSYIEGMQNSTAAFFGDVPKKVSRTHSPQVVEKLKSITGGDPIAYHRMYIGSESRRLPCRITMAGNNVPELFDDSGALMSRMLLLVFNVSFYGREDRDLEDKLLAELPGIAEWARWGYMRLQTQKQFTEPAACREELDAIGDDYAPLRRYIAERMTPERRAGVPSDTLYEDWKAWTLVDGGTPNMSKQSLVRAIVDTARGMPSYTRTKRAQFYDQGRRVRGVYHVELRPTLAAVSTG